MKKLTLLAAVLLGTAVASQAGVQFGFGLTVPLGSPAPVVASPPPVVYQAPAPPPVVYQPPTAPCYTPAPVVYAPAPVVCAPAPKVYFRFGPGWYGHYHGGWAWGHHYYYGHR